MSDGFKLFSGLFCIKYILMAAFGINLLDLKKLKPTEVRKNVCHFWSYLPDFYVFLWPLKSNNYSLVHSNIKNFYIFFFRK